MYSVPSTQVLYNHVPRCGGRSVSAIFRLLALKNKYQVLNLGAHEVMVPAKQVRVCVNALVLYYGLYYI